MRNLLISEHEFKVFELFAGFSDFISRVVKSVTVLMFSAGLVVGEHAVATVHRENFIINTAVVTVLVAEIVQLLAELSNQLIFLTGTECNSMVKLNSHYKLILFIARDLLCLVTLSVMFSTMKMRSMSAK